jgi:folate-binding protein YgfZ
MKAEDLEKYNLISAGNIGFIERKRGLIEVSGKEAVQFLNGLITNDVAKLEPYKWMPAAFPNAQGRLLAMVRVMRFDDKFRFETEGTTHEKVFQNLFRFTFAGDFFVEDLSENFASVSLFGEGGTDFKIKAPDENEIEKAKFEDGRGFVIRAIRGDGCDFFIPRTSMEGFLNILKKNGGLEISDELYEVLRIERGIPLYGFDMDETTIVPELGIDGLISYQKGCYIGQEIIARIYFRGHVAKQLKGLILSEPRAEDASGELKNAELKSAEGKNAGKITSAVFSPKLGKTVALGFVRYDYLAEGTELKIGDGAATVKNLPFEF